MYSTVFDDLASHGFKVVTMENRDGSSARLYVNVPEGRRSPELSQDERGGASGSEIEPATEGEDDGKPKGTRSYMVDYIFTRI